MSSQSSLEQAKLSAEQQTVPDEAPVSQETEKVQSLPGNNPLFRCRDCESEFLESEMQTEDNGRARCNACNRVRPRVNRLGQKDPGLRRKFYAMSHESRKNFLAQAYDLLGEDLKKVSQRLS